MSKLMVGWTTVANEDDADKLARNLLNHKLAACVQVDPPIRSYYNWEGTMHCDTEYRLKIKFVTKDEAHLMEWLKKHHPYTIPQWYAMEASTLPAYLKWAIETTER
ncbi:divalent-cation tolerance protein CutA [Rubellicoccus peritrichatus]|uniref:Divalent-cation tolerance protein CutA n=1 Tax=Rubellicoccus peritrichatus TaxID=3080537 RepID=A0AAQ3L664_9BACT|nr:divalent-cation tolerance protein CutA [Puniceicoccus sp. CR14]WOO40010.1 divalent-cation tolerance protein CutA [Puniceicoccus sp. CR14]